MHQHYNADGDYTGHTVVTRESLWDESARGRALRLQEHEDAPVSSTGLPMAEAHKEQPFKVDKFVDYAHRAVERVKRADRADAEKKYGKDKVPEGLFDGHHYYAVLPDQSELREDPGGN